MYHVNFITNAEISFGIKSLCMYLCYRERSVRNSSLHIIEITKKHLVWRHEVLLWCLLAETWVESITQTVAHKGEAQHGKCNHQRGEQPKVPVHLDVAE